MCGISGWVCLGGEPPEPELASRMLERIRHRGPDDTGLFQNSQVCLGMTRLSINDLAGGKQPYRSEDGSVIAVFNGEIYNFRQLRQELEARGHSFISHTDGEVIVHLYEEHGPDFVKLLNGMFAIALWDGEDLYLFRDRFGIKPLYYAQVGETVVFGSELKCLTQWSKFDRRLDHAALASYLSVEYVPAPLSIFAQAKKLSPGHYLKVGEEPRRYWDFPAFRPAGGSLEDWAERLHQELRRSVERRLLADVPLGVFLSGGLDSSSLTALMCEICPGNIKTFSIGFEEKSFDESHYFREVAAHLGTEHHDQILSPDVALEILDPLYEQLDEPLADAAIIPTYLLSRFARQYVTVALAGEGADELLAGYPTYFAHQLAQPLNVMPGWWHSLIRWLVGWLPTSRRYLSLDFKIKKFASGLGLPVNQRHLAWMGSFTPGQVDQLLLRPVSPGVDFGATGAGLGLVERAQTLDFHSYLANGLLTKLDRATMAVSLEGRVPFLDHQLVEAMAQLPTEHKLRGLDAKRVLKKALGPQLPQQVVKRSKKGFGIPIADWLRGPLRSLMDEYLRPEYLQAQGLFRHEPIQRLVQEHLTGRADHRKPLWTLLVFQRWARVYKPVI